MQTHDMVQNDLQAIKDKIRQLESGSCSGITVGSDVSTAVGRGSSGTFARPHQGVAGRLSDLFMSRQMKFKGWVTDYKQCRYQELTVTEVSDLINDRYNMVLDAQKNRLIGTKPRTNKERGQPKLW